MSYNDQRTRAFEAVDNSINESRRKVVIAIFVVIALILAAFATLIVGKIVSTLPEHPNPSSNKNMTYIPKDAGDIKIGFLLSVNDSHPYVLPDNFDNMVKLYDYHSADLHPENTSKIQINGNSTYAISWSRIVLEETTLEMFNQMILDYCISLGSSASNTKSLRNIELAWGGYNADTLLEYDDDLSNIGKDFYDHILGTSLTLKKNDPSMAITEEILKKDFEWIYKNAHKYGFIIRYPEACKNHTGIDSSKRVHLRYIGAEHAAYIYQNNICFEEYLELLRNQHNSYDKAINIQIEDTTYLVYYVKYTGNPTSIPVPKNSTYTISGDNMNGFIVSVEK